MAAICSSSVRSAAGWPAAETTREYDDAADSAVRRPFRDTPNTSPEIQGRKRPPLQYRAGSGQDAVDFLSALLIIEGVITAGPAGRPGSPTPEVGGHLATALQTAQAIAPDWAALAASYLAGRLLWMSDEPLDHIREVADTWASASRVCLADPDSPWNQLPLRPE
ncbi:DUF1266 domain-containing protein [Nesterenkonia alkaliphila]|uniref:DUF1266 domain-containing protein n=1 Tax=Nesterenkonia alkaliphila TaxID=1463631 RepID=A0A7K1UEJ9_9MICC|nr:DUF1266 domain-containing protein [Nesterenkonia alkaliphila]